jgi:hypothetical protein
MPLENRPHESEDSRDVKVFVDFLSSSSPSHDAFFSTAVVDDAERNPVWHAKAPEADRNRGRSLVLVVVLLRSPTEALHVHGVALAGTGPENGD